MCCTVVYAVPELLVMYANLIALLLAHLKGDICDACQRLSVRPSVRPLYDVPFLIVCPVVTSQKLCKIDP